MLDRFFFGAPPIEATAGAAPATTDDLDELWIAEYGADAALQPVMLRLRGILAAVSSTLRNWRRWRRAVAG